MTNTPKSYAVNHLVIPEIIVEGKRLGRNVRHDSRSLWFLHKASGRPIVSIRHQRYVPVFDQGNVGSCTGNAMTGALATGPFFNTVPKSTTLNEAEALSIYSAAEILDGDGPYPPNDNGSTGLSVATVAKNWGLISGYNHALTVADALDALLDGPVITGVPWMSGMDSPSSSGLVKATGTVRGGHEFVVDEIDAANKLVGFTNSWGSGWSVGGRAFISWADWAKLLTNQGDVTTLVPVTLPAPTPVQPSTFAALESNLHTIDTDSAKIEAWVTAHKA